VSYNSWNKATFEAATGAIKYEGQWCGLLGKSVYAEIIRVALTPEQESAKMSPIAMYHVLPDPF
jgi:hypothetical protein